MNATPVEGVRWEELWNPELVVQNLMYSKLEKVWRSVELTATGEAHVIEKRRVKGNFSESMELQSFPFDTQCLSVIITSESQDMDFCEDNIQPSRINHDNFVDQQEWSAWDIVEFVNQDCSTLQGTDRVTSPTGQPVATFRMYADRQSGHFVVNVFTIMGIITSLFLCIWSEEHTNPAARLKLTFTLILTTVAFKFVTNQSMPNISYTTILDKYILSALCLLHVSACFHALLSQAGHSSPHTHVLDLAGFIIFTFVFLILQLSFVVVVHTKKRGER